MNKRINHLLQQFEAGLLNKAEKEELLTLAEQEPDLVSEEIVELIILGDNNTQFSAIDKKWNSVLKKVLSVDQVNLKSSRYLFSVRWAAAAAIIFAISLGAYLLFVNQGKNEEHVFVNDVLPGSNQAVLTLADGKKISLNDIKDGDLIKESGISISKTASGHLVYTIEESENITDESKVNTISTPNGGEWEVRLPDGSTVWLNAASSLKYPLNISKAKQRLVELTGEAYFEVKKDKEHPFIVKTNKQQLEVLGTHFNINSYLDESVTRTTLFEGSVKIAEINDPNKFELLSPGEQSILSSKGITVKTVDVDEAIAWKNGYFMFNNERQESILRKIARWYNVQIEYIDPEAKDVMYYGTVSRFEKISKVLRKFEQTGEVRYDIKGNTLMVYKD